MVMSGLIVLAFIVYHIAHFTVRVTDHRFGLLKADPLGHYDVYSMMVYGFQNYYVSGFYVLGLFLLALHLSHGSSSFFQSLGLNDKKARAASRLGWPNLRVAAVHRLHVDPHRCPAWVG